MAKTTPFEIKDGIEASDDTRLRYRYLDLRRPEMLSNFKLCTSNSRQFATTWTTWNLLMWKRQC
jgi:aspartyl-tRNA synthetase